MNLIFNFQSSIFNFQSYRPAPTTSGDHLVYSDTHETSPNKGPVPPQKKWGGAGCKHEENGLDLLCYLSFFLRNLFFFDAFGIFFHIFASVFARARVEL